MRFWEEGKKSKIGNEEEIVRVSRSRVVIIDLFRKILAICFVFFFFVKPNWIFSRVLYYVIFYTLFLSNLYKYCTSLCKSIL